MNRKYKIINVDDTLDLDHISDLIGGKQKISLIKNIRYCSGMGLKDSKELVEKYISLDGSYDANGLINKFEQYLEISKPLQKEEFLHIIEEAIDNMSTFHYIDMLDVVTDLCNNIHKKGGLTKIAEEHDKFLRNI